MKHIFLIQFFLIQFIFSHLVSFAQDKEYVVGEGFRTIQPSLEKIFGKPIISKITEEFRIKVWLMSQDEYKTKMTSNQNEMKVDEKTREMLIQGTHQVRVNVMNTKTKKVVSDAEVWFHIIYPNKKNSMPRLLQISDHFVSGIDLSQKGKYTFMVHVNMDDKQPSITFVYVMK